MSQTTRCPACHTRFKVVADQLRISDGWVRCGECSKVFDATSSLEAVEIPALLPDLHLEDLRGPVEKVKPASAAMAWQAGEKTATPHFAHQLAAPTAAPPHEGSHGVPETMPNFAEWTLPSKGPLLGGGPREVERDVPEQAEPEAAVDGADVTQHGMRPATDPPAVPQQHTQALHLRPSEGASATAPWQLAHASRIDMAVHAEVPGTQAASCEPVGNWESDAARLAGYELPGSQLEEDGEAAVFASSSEIVPLADSSESPISSSDSGFASTQWPDHVQTQADLARFLAEFTSEPDSPRTEQSKPSTLPVTAHYEPAPTAETQEQPAELPGLEDLAPASEPLAEHADTSLGARQVLPSADASYQAFGSDLMDSHWDEETPYDQAQEPSFVRHARKRAFWMRAQVRACLWFAALILLLALAGQFGLQFRDQIAARFPNTRSALVSTCGFVGCVVGPPRDIGAIVVEGSSFNRIQGDQYQFLLTLRNRSAQDVQSPVIELTLTDAQDQVVVRRVLAADELKLPKVFIPQEEWSGEIPMSMAPGSAHIAGFRALAFYPN